MSQTPRRSARRRKEGKRNQEEESVMRVCRGAVFGPWKNSLDDSTCGGLLEGLIYGVSEASLSSQYRQGLE